MRRIWLPGAILVFAGAALGQEFEVVSVKPNNTGSGSSHSNSDQGRLTGTNLSLRDLIVNAYGIRDYQLQGPEWLKTQRFDIAGKFPEALSKDRDKYRAALESMMRKMLADRFKLAVHRDQKTFSVYGLVVAKGGIKFKEVPDGEAHNSSSNNTHYKGTCVSIAGFADFLARRRSELPVDLPVLDMTGLKGFYDLTLDWFPEPRPWGHGKTDVPVALDKSGPTLLVAIEEQLGLKLETRKAPIEILIVDHAEKVPTEN